MSRPVIAVDFDDVLFPFMNIFVPHYNEKYDVTFHLDDYWTFEFEQVWNEDRTLAWQRVGEFLEEPHADVEPVSGAVEGVDVLRRNYDIVIVTARDESLRTHTQNWIDKHFPDCFRDVFLCNTYVVAENAMRRTKAEIVRETSAVALIDDSLRNVTQVAEAGKQGILFGNFAWNQAESLPPGITRHVEWRTISERFAA